MSSQNLKFKKGGLIYLLGLPRKALFDLYNLVPSDIVSDESAFQRIFGRPPYTFAVPETLNEAAPRREFGVLGVSLNARVNAYRDLPEELREYIVEHYPSIFLGFYIDKIGRCYKQEDGKRWTVLSTSLVRSKEGITDSFPKIDDEFELRHVHDPNQTIQVQVNDIGQFKKASAVIYLTSVT
jgi:hypothetical protein